MSIQSEINRLKQAVSDAFTAIGNKGGTVPTSKVSGNLESAINSIPAGVTVQQRTGTFTTNSSGQATINCGFTPDLVVVYGGAYNNGEWNFTFTFSEKATSYEDLVCQIQNTTGTLIAIASKATNGFSFQVNGFGWDWSVTTAGNNKQFSYTTVKYTS